MSGMSNDDEVDAVCIQQIVISLWVLSKFDSASEVRNCQSQAQEKEDGGCKAQENQ